MPPTIWGDAFWALCDISGGSDACWPWRGMKNEWGYGKVGGTIASRRAYEIAVGPIPTGLTIDHLCFNPPCVNPAHLEPVTMRENLHRQRAASKPACHRGHAFDEANTYLRLIGGFFRRSCRLCNRGAVARYKSRRQITSGAS